MLRCRLVVASSLSPEAWSIKASRTRIHGLGSAIPPTSGTTPLIRRSVPTFSFDLLTASAKLERARARVTIQDFETELRERRAHLAAMAARCERIVSLAVVAFGQGDRLLAAQEHDLQHALDDQGATRAPSKV
jgi:hypothetical protein